MLTGGSFLTTKIEDFDIFSPEQFSDIQREFAKIAQEFAEKEIFPQKQ